MTQQQRTREEYSALIARAFNGAITVDGQRIVAHPSGMLFARVPSVQQAVRRSLTIRDRSRLIVDPDNDWSNV